jgi:hypothetical protein
VPVLAAEQAVTTDEGTLDQESAEKAFPAKAPYSPYAGRNFPTRPFFGDTHLHTSFSMDAGAFGARLGPKDAYRFAKGEEVIASSGQHAKLSRPLDFLVVTDHSDGMGFFPQLMNADPVLMATPQGRKWYDQISSPASARVSCRRASRRRAHLPIAAPGARPSKRRKNQAGLGSIVAPDDVAMKIVSSRVRSPFVTDKGREMARIIGSNPSPPSHRSGAPILATSGSGWRCARKTPAPKSSRWRTTAI